MAADADPALESLFLPFVEGRLVWPDAGVLFLRARGGWPLHQWARTQLVCEQSFKPEAAVLQRSGLTVRDFGDAKNPDASCPHDRDVGRYPLVLLLPPRQRDESRALMARALAACAPGGRVVSCVANNEGAKSAEDDLRRIAGPVATLTKNKCRVFWTAPLHGAATADGADGDAERATPAGNPVLAAQWAAFDRVQPIADGRFVSRPGVFAWDRIDPASALLAAHLPADLAGRAADLGAGFGYLSAELLARCPRITAIDLYEAEGRALDLARRNLASHGGKVALDYHWHDVTGGLPKRYDVIVTNPPFHTQSRADRPDIGRRFIAVAAEALNPGGRLWLVANRHLPYEQVLNERFGSVRTVAQQDGFKIVEAVKARGAGGNR